MQRELEITEFTALFEIFTDVNHMENAFTLPCLIRKTQPAVCALAYKKKLLKKKKMRQLHEVQNERKRSLKQSSS